jgi:membrane-associated phospholipid phosphatase
MVAGLMIAHALPWRRIGWAVGGFVILLMPVTVIVTGNHYWLDVVGGWLVIGVSLLINRWLPFPLPIRWPWQDAPQPRQSTPEPAAA